MIQYKIDKLKRALVFLHDSLASIVAWYLAYQLRFNFEVSSENLAILFFLMPIVVIIQITLFFPFGLHRGIWRFASAIDLQRIIISVFMATTLLIIILFMLRFDYKILVPRSLLIIYPLLLIFIMGGSRFLYRAFKERQAYGLVSLKGEPILIIGSGHSAISLAKELAQDDKWRVIGFLDKNKSFRGREISGFKVLGDLSNLANIHKRFRFKKLVIVSSDIDHIERRAVLDLATLLKIDVLTIPIFDDLISGRLSISKIQPIEVEDLLGRDKVDLDIIGLRQLIKSKSVLISGAAGSIGSELCRQIINFEPSQLICLDISEHGLYQLKEELGSIRNSVELIYVIGDVKNEARLKVLFHEYRPSIVFHAAAYKHVPLMENRNVSEVFYNNVIGTNFIAKVSKSNNVEKFILISTDKAVNPTNVMGASKRLSEMLCQGLQDKTGTSFVAVRFGNVLGSSGSVIPKFRQQIKSGGPVTVTHPEITRYFMSIPEAAQLVLQACSMGNPGEIFILDMGKPVRIVDLARDMIRLSGFTQDEIKIEFSGLRPGEKLFEELLADGEQTKETSHKKLRIALTKTVDIKWTNSMLKWIFTIPDKDERLIKKELKTWVKEYQGNINAN